MPGRRSEKIAHWGALAAAAMLALGTAWGASKRPTNASLRKAFERNRDTVVEIRSPRGRGAGVIVGDAGQIATSIDHVGTSTATVRWGGRDRPARVTLADSRLRIALVELEVSPGEELAPAAVDSQAALAPGTWLVGIDRPSDARSRPAPSAGRVIRGARAGDPFVVTDLPLHAGSPLFDVRGRLVAIAVERMGRIGSRAVPVSLLQAQVASPSPP